MDNGSTDDSLRRLAPLEPGIRLIPAGRNTGYGAGMNRAAAAARGRRLLILNSDAEPRPGALRALMERARGSAVPAMLAPRLVNDDGSIQRSVSLVRGPRDALATSTILGSLGLVRRRRQELDLQRLTEPTDVGPQRYLWGAALLLERSLFRDVGGFDERFFLFFEDEDLSRRVTAAGARQLYVPEAVFLHRRGLSRRQVRRDQQYWYYRSYLRYLRKYSGSGGFGRWAALFFPTFVMDLLFSLWRDALGLVAARGERRRSLTDKIEARWGILTRRLPDLARELLAPAAPAQRSTQDSGLTTESRGPERDGARSFPSRES